MKVLQKLNRLTLLAIIVVLPIISVAIFKLMITSINPPQCPEHYTQAQVDASNCIIGANIGGPILIFLVLLAIPLVAAIFGLAVLALVRSYLKRPKKTDSA